MTGSNLKKASIESGGKVCLKIQKYFDGVFLSIRSHLLKKLELSKNNYKERKFLYISQKNSAFPTVFTRICENFPYTLIYE